MSDELFAKTNSNTLSAASLAPSSIVFSTAKGPISISLKTGNVDLSQFTGELSEAAQGFWEAVQKVGSRGTIAG